MIARLEETLHCGRPPTLRHCALEFFGDELEAIRSFDPASQRTLESLNVVLITPAREVLNTLPATDPVDGGTDEISEFDIPRLHPVSASILDYLDDRALVLIDDYSSLDGMMEEIEQQARSLFTRTHLGWDLDTIGHISAWALSLPLRAPEMMRALAAHGRLLGLAGSLVVLTFIAAVAYSLTVATASCGGSRPGSSPSRACPAGATSSSWPARACWPPRPSRSRCWAPTPSSGRRSPTAPPGSGSWAICSCSGLVTKVVKGTHILGFSAVSIIAGFINRASTLPKKMVELEYINMSKSVVTNIEFAGNIIFWNVVSIFGIWVISKYFVNINKLRGEG